jgi:solute carrier family 25 S-adenosylmethionine transporter 26
MSVPHGAVNFAVLEYVRRQMNTLLLQVGWTNEKTLRAYGPTLDFLSSAISTVACSIVSTPQMMITDNIMAGTYPNFLAAISGLSKDKGLGGFYTGWWPGLAGKIPSYALTWSFFQQLKEAQLRIFKRPPKDIENSIMGCLSGAMTVCIMIPMDTIKTRLVTQMQYPDLVPYNGIVDCALRITKEEGMGAFYRGLTPRLISVVPMIGIQFGVYEFMKKVMVSRSTGEALAPRMDQNESSTVPSLTQESKKNFFQKAKTIEEVIMEVAADDDQPFPAPHSFDDDK